MKKIMFNDRYGLTEAVLSGRKTMTRRVIKGDYVKIAHLEHEGSFIGKTANGESVILPQPAYNVGEEVAIAQCYEEARKAFAGNQQFYLGYYTDVENAHQKLWEDIQGVYNKMFVRADLMPHRIRITKTKLERLQDISEEDCLREGIQEYFPYIDRNPNDRVRTFQYFRDGKIRHRMSPAPECFALLIDDICGHGTWQRNPWVYAYEFELLR